MGETLEEGALDHPPLPGVEHVERLAHDGAALAVNRAPEGAVELGQGAGSVRLLDGGLGQRTRLAAPAAQPVDGSGAGQVHQVDER
jgi:hypothetical protein